MAVSYDENVIVTFAERLYRRAATVVLVYTLLSAILGALAVKAVVSVYSVPSDSADGMTIVIALIAAGLGAVAGTGRAFVLRLQAQQALCQMHIERNTRALMISRWR